MSSLQTAPKDASPYLVKGSTIRSKFEFVRARAGDDAERRFREPFEARGTILDSGWYPFRLYDEVNAELARRFLAGDESRLQEVGRFSADRAFSGVYKTFLSSASFDRFLERIASLHGLMYSEGDMRVEPDAERNACRILQSGAPEYTTRDLYVAQGFYAQAAKLFELRGVSCRFRQDPDGVVFELTWS